MMKTRNAYILIYERDEFIDQGRFNELIGDDKAVLQVIESKGSYKTISKEFYDSCRLPRTVSTQIQMQPSIHESILEKNKRFWLLKFIFERTFLEQTFEIYKNFGSE